MDKVSIFLLFLFFSLLAPKLTVAQDENSCDKEKKKFTPNPIAQPTTISGRLSTTTSVSEYQSCDVTVNPDASACKCPCGSELISVTVDVNGGRRCLSNPPKAAPVEVNNIERTPDSIPGLWGWWDAEDTNGDGLVDLAGRADFPGACGTSRCVWDSASNTCSNPAITTQAACENIKPVHDLTSWADKSGNGRHFECPDAIKDYVRVRSNRADRETRNSWAWSSYSPLNTCSHGDSRCCPNGKNADAGDHTTPDNKCIYKPICPYIKDRRWTNVALHRSVTADTTYASNANYGPMKATDGSSVWYHDSNICFRVTGNWMVIDLGKERRISHIRYHPTSRDKIYLTARVGSNSNPRATGSSANPVCGTANKAFEKVRPDTWTCTSENGDPFMLGQYVIIKAASNNFYGCEVEAYEDTRHPDTTTVKLPAGSRRPVVRFEGYNEMTLKLADQLGSSQNDMTVPRPFTIVTVARYAGYYRNRIIASRENDLRHGFWGKRQNVFHNKDSSWTTSPYAGHGMVEDGASEGPLIVHAFTSNTTIPLEFNWRRRDYRDAHEREARHHFYTNGVETSDNWYQKHQWSQKRYTGDPGRIQLGMAYLYGADHSHAEVSEMMIFNRNISESERKGLERYLANKWDIVTMKKETDQPEFVAAESRRNKTCAELNWPDMSSAAIGSDGKDCHTRVRGSQYCQLNCPCGDGDGWSTWDRQTCKRGTNSIPSVSCNPKYNIESTSCNYICLAFPELKEKLQETCARGDGCQPDLHSFLDKDTSDKFGACDNKGCPSPATEYMVKYTDAVKYCETQGARLCSFQELWRGEAEDSGCATYQKIWSLNKCDSGGDLGRWATAKNSKKNGNVNADKGNLTACLAEDTDDVAGDLAFPMCCSSKVPNANFDSSKAGLGWSSPGCPGETCAPSCKKPPQNWELAEKLGMCGTKSECGAKGYTSKAARDDCFGNGFATDGLVLHWMVASHMFPNNCACDCRNKDGIVYGANTNVNRRPRDCERYCYNGVWTGGYRGFAALNHIKNKDTTTDYNVKGYAANPYKKTNFHNTYWEDPAFDIWTITLVSTQNIVAPIGAHVLQGNRIGYLSVALSGAGTSEVKIRVANGVTFDAASDLEIGNFCIHTITINGSYITDSITKPQNVAVFQPGNSDSFRGSLNVALNGATGNTITVVVKAAPSYVFDTSVDMVLGTTKILAAAILSATKQVMGPIITIGSASLNTATLKDNAPSTRLVPNLDDSIMCDYKIKTTTNEYTQRTCPWKDPKATQKWGPTTETEPWPSSNQNPLAPFGDTKSGKKRRCNGWWGYHGHMGKERSPVLQEYNGCACHASGLEYHFQNQWDRIVKLNTVPVLGESVVMEDWVVPHYTVAPGEPRWVDYIDNGRDFSRCGGPRAGRNINLRCHYQKVDDPFEEKYFFHHAAVAATYVYAETAREVSIKFRAAKTGILYLNGQMVDGSDQHRDNDGNMNRASGNEGSIKVDVSLVQGQNWFLYHVNGRDGNLGFVLYIEENEGLVVSTTELGSNIKPSQCVPTPFGLKENPSIPTTPVDRAQCLLCGNDFFCSRNKTFPGIDFIDPLRSDTNDNVDQREITKLSVSVHGDFGLDAAVDVDPLNVAGFSLNNVSLGNLQGVGSAGTWRCNTCYETERWGIEMNAALESAYSYYDKAAGTNKVNNGLNTIQLTLPPNHAWCIAKVTLDICAKPGPPKIFTVHGIDGSNPANLAPNGGKWLEFRGQNLNNQTFKELRYGPDGKPAFKTSNCTFHEPMGVIIRCLMPRGVGGPYTIRVVTDSISVPSEPYTNITYANPVVNQITLKNYISAPQDEPGGASVLRLDPDGGTSIILQGTGLMKGFTEHSQVQMSVISLADSENVEGLQDVKTQLYSNDQIQLIVKLGKIGETRSLRTIAPRFRVRYRVFNDNNHINWPPNINNLGLSNIIGNINLTFAQPEIKRTYLTYDQENSTAVRTNMEIRVAGTGLCDTDDCCQLRSCDCTAENQWVNGICVSEDLGSCIYIKPLTVQGGECTAEGGVDNTRECRKKIDGWNSRIFKYPEGQTTWVKKSVRIISIFYDLTASGDHTWELGIADKTLSSTIQRGTVVTQVTSTGSTSIGTISNTLRGTINKILITVPNGQLFVAGVNVAFQSGGAIFVSAEELTEAVNKGRPEVLYSFPTKLQDKNPVCNSPTTIEFNGNNGENILGGQRSIECKYITPATTDAYLVTEEGLKYSIEIVKIIMLDQSDITFKDKSIVTVNIPPGTGLNNQLIIEVSGNPAEPIAVRYPEPTITRAQLISSIDNEIESAFKARTLGDDIFVIGDNFGLSCEEIKLPQVCTPGSPDSTTDSPNTITRFTCSDETPPKAKGKHSPTPPEVGKFCQHFGCSYDTVSKQCIVSANGPQYTTVQALLVSSDVAGNVTNSEGVTSSGIDVALAITALARTKITAAIPPGQNIIAIGGLFADQQPYYTLKVNTSGQEVLGTCISCKIKYKSPTITKIESYDSNSALRTDGTSKIKITGTDFGTETAQIQVFVGTGNLKKLCSFSGIVDCCTQTSIKCKLPKGSGKNVAVNVYINNYGVDDTIYPAERFYPRDTSFYGTVSYDPPVITSVSPNEDLPTSGFIHNRITNLNINDGVRLNVADGYLDITLREKNYMINNFRESYMHMSKAYVEDKLRETLEQWAERAIVTINGYNFGPPNSTKVVRLHSKSTNFTTIISSFIEHTQTTLKFYLPGGTGKLDIILLIGEQEGIYRPAGEMSASKATLKYAPPKIHQIEWSKSNGPFQTPTSGCAEFDVMPVDADKRPCKRRASMILHGTNFGEKRPTIKFTLQGVEREVEPFKNDHYQLHVGLPEGFGIAKVQVVSSGVESNIFLYRYTKPSVTGLLSGTAIETARTSDMFDARGIKENKIFLFGQNFGEEASSVNITISGVPCTEPSWHEASRYSSPPGKPYLSCRPGVHVVGAHSVFLKVAETEVTITKTESGKTIDARCPQEQYGKIGERCVPCWKYSDGKNTLPAATCTGKWVSRKNNSFGNVDNILSRGNATEWGRKVALAPKGSDVFTGTEDPIALPGFQIFPPPECSNGGCIPDPSLSSEVALPASCMAMKKDGRITIPVDCVDAEVPGPFCHPYRFRGLCIETSDNVITCTSSSMNEKPLDLEYKVVYNKAQVISKSPRLVCPHILRCEPPEACIGGFQCAHGYVSYYEAFNNLLETLNPETGAREIKVVEGKVCSPRHFTLPDGTCYAPRCGQCNPKTHFRLEGECAACPEFPWLMPLILVLIALLSGVGMYFLTKKNVNLAILSIGIDYFQVLGLFTRSRVNWPPEIKWLFRQFQWAMFDVDLTAPECAFRQFMTYENKFYIKLLIPILGVTSIGIFLSLNTILTPFLCPSTIHGLEDEENDTNKVKNKNKVKVIPQSPESRKEEEGDIEESKENPRNEKRGPGNLTKKKSHFEIIKEKHAKKNAHKHRSAKPGSRSFAASMISMFITTVYFMYLSITRATLDVVNCQDTDPPSGKLYMASMPLEECGVPGGLQVRVLPAALVFLIFYCIGFPIAVVYIFFKKKDNIHQDQHLRAHGRGMHPISNPNYEFRQRFSRLYYQYKPHCYWWIIVIVFRKFAICFAGVALRSSATFQLCFALVIMFLAFVLQVIYQPFLGIKERGQLLRRENTKNMEHEAKRLRAMLVIQRLMDNDIQGDDDAFKAQQKQQDKIRSLDTEREAIDSIIHRKHKWWYNENNIELTLLGASVLVPLAGIMFNSRYLEREGTEGTKTAITYTVIVVIISSVIYFLVVLIHAIFHSREANRISPQIYWARLRINLTIVLEKIKGRSRSKKRIAAIQSGLGISTTPEQVNQQSVANFEHVQMMTEMMNKMSAQMAKLQEKENKIHETMKEVSVRVARSEMVSKSIASIAKTAQFARSVDSSQRVASVNSVQVNPVPLHKLMESSSDEEDTDKVQLPEQVSEPQNIHSLRNLMMSSSSEEEHEDDESEVIGQKITTL